MQGRWDITSFQILGLTLGIMEAAWRYLLTSDYGTFTEDYWSVFIANTLGITIRVLLFWPQWLWCGQGEDTNGGWRRGWLRTTSWSLSCKASRPWSIPEVQCFFRDARQLSRVYCFFLFCFTAWSLRSECAHVILYGSPKAFSEHVTLFRVSINNIT